MTNTPPLPIGQMTYTFIMIPFLSNIQANIQINITKDKASKKEPK